MGIEASKDHVDRVRQMAGEYGIAVSEDQAALMVRHLALVERKNEVVNLTRIVDTQDGLVRHIVDSLLFVPPIVAQVMRTGGDGRLRVMDLGTGAGYPGIPLTVMADVDVTLLDSVEKKTRAVDEFVRELGLEDRAHALHGRVEDVAREEGQTYDVVTARAVASLNVLVEYAAPLLRKGGILVASKGRPTQEEREAGERAARLCGMEPVSRETYELPDEAGHREIYVYRKVSKPKVRLPRQSGMAKRSPLG